MRDIPHPIFVVTPFPPQISNSSGLLVSSFNTVTLRPRPHVSFNIKIPSSTYNAILASGQFAVYPVSDLATYLLYASKEVVNTTQETRKSQVAALRKSLWYLRCKRSRNHCTTVFDHEIMVGEVVSIVPQKVPQLNYASFHWRQGYREFWPPEMYTSDQFENRLRVIQDQTYRLQVVFNRLVRWKNKAAERKQLKPNHDTQAVGVNASDTDDRVDAPSQLS